MGLRAPCRVSCAVFGLGHRALPFLCLAPYSPCLWAHASRGGRGLCPRQSNTPTTRTRAGEATNNGKKRNARRRLSASPAPAPASLSAPVMTTELVELVVASSAAPVAATASFAASTAAAATWTTTKAALPSVNSDDDLLDFLKSGIRSQEAARLEQERLRRAAAASAARFTARDYAQAPLRPATYAGETRAAEPCAPWPRERSPRAPPPSQGAIRTQRSTQTRTATFLIPQLML